MMHPFAVVCQQQQSLGVEVEPTDGIDALAAVFDELGDGLSPFFVRERADIAARLVEHEIALFPLPRKGLAVDRDAVRVGIGFLPDERCLAVHAHAPCGDPLLGGAPGAEPRFGDEFLNSCLGQKDPPLPRRQKLPERFRQRFLLFRFFLASLCLHAARAHKVDRSNRALSAGDDECTEFLSLLYGFGNSLRQLGAHAQRFSIRNRITKALCRHSGDRFPRSVHAAVSFALFRAAAQVIRRKP